MAEQLYTIPVNDAFDTDCECPVSAMYMKLENDALDYTLGHHIWKKMLGQ